jgi:DNA-binding MarR family transcriptional regulator
VDPQELLALDDTMMRLRRVWALPPASSTQRLPTENDQIVELSSVLVVEACVRGEVSGHSATVADVAAFAGVAPSTASRFVGRAERAGLVERQRAPGDARRAAIRTTEAGEALHARSRRFRMERLREVLQDWSSGDVSAFVLLLSRFATDATDPARGAPLVPPPPQDHDGRGEEPGVRGG